MKRIEYENNPKHCTYCNTIIPYNKRRNSFCNHSCSASFNNSGVVRNGKQANVKNCLHCTKELSKKRNTKYCNKKCHSDYKYSRYIHKWKIGEVSGCIGNHGAISKYIRIYLFDKFNNSCAECGWDKINPTTGNCPLQIDHIDGNYMNNDEDNLNLLCPSCHSLTSTYGSLNNGFGRTQRHTKK